MGKKINLIELLKDCPQGIELYSPIFGKVYLDKIRPHLAIVVTTDKEQGDFKEEFLYDGRYGINGECMLFPSKGQTTWKEYQRSFKDGDILIGKSGQPFIFKKLNHREGCYSYCGIDIYGQFKLENDDWTFVDSLRFATEEEKAKLFQAIEDNRYKWNEETKTLEKLIEPKFKDGDIVATNSGNWIAITEGGEKGKFMPIYCLFKNNSEFEAYFVTKKEFVFNRLATEEEKQKLFQIIKNNGYKWNSETKTLEELIEPKFKVGDRIRHKENNKDDIYEISKVYGDSYGIVGFTWMLYRKYQDNYELVPKFDINTLKSFDKVLVRDTNEQVWLADFFSHKVGTELEGYNFVCVGHYSYQCIPYDGNEDLCGTKNDCDEYYKTWK